MRRILWILSEELGEGGRRDWGVNSLIGRLEGGGEGDWGDWKDSAR